MIEDEPALIGPKRRRRQPNLVGIPPASAPGAQQDVMVAPVLEVGRPRNPHVGADPEMGRHWAMDHRVAAAEADREKRRVLVLWRHNRAEPGEGLEILGSCER